LAKQVEINALTRIFLYMLLWLGEDACIVLSVLLILEQNVRYFGRKIHVCRKKKEAAENSCG